MQSDYFFQVTCAVCDDDDCSSRLNVNMHLLSLASHLHKNTFSIAQEK